MTSPDSPPPAPIWVKIGAALFVALLLVVVLIHLAGGGFSHGPG